MQPPAVDPREEREEEEEPDQEQQEQGPPPPSAGGTDSDGDNEEDEFEDSSEDDDNGSDDDDGGDDGEDEDEDADEDQKLEARAEGEEDYPTLYAAVRAGDVEGARRVHTRYVEYEERLQAGEDAGPPPRFPLHAPGGKYRVPPFILAAKRGDAAMVCAIGAMGPNLNERNDGVGTALMAAAKRPSAETVRALLELGCDPNVRSERLGYTALHANLLAHPDFDPSDEEVVDEADDALEALLEAEGVDVDARAKPWADTPLLNAIMSCRLGAVMLLLKHGARADVQYPKFGSPADLLLHARPYWGPYLGFPDVLSALLKAGARIRPKNFEQAQYQLRMAMLMAESRERTLKKWRTDPRRQAIAREEIAGLAQDHLELREAEAALEAKRVRVMELEAELLELGDTSGDEGEGEAAGAAAASGGST